MARNRIHLTAAPEEVAAYLSDARLYPYWVVGAVSFRDADPDFPAAGTRFHHRVGLWPLTLADHTEVRESDLPRRLVLHAKARPFGTARIEFVLTPDGGGTTLTMTETPGDLLSRLFMGNPLADVLLRLRNAEALSRLGRLIEAPRSQAGVTVRRSDGLHLGDVETSDDLASARAGSGGVRQRGG